MNSQYQLSILTKKPHFSPSSSQQTSHFLSTNFQGQFLKKRREELKLSAMDVAKRLGFNNISKTATQIEKYETTRSTIPAVYIERLLEVYKVPLEKFTTLTSDSHPHNAPIIAHNKQIDLQRLQKKIDLLTALPLLYTHYDEIIANDDLYFSSVEGARIGSMYVSRKEPNLYLGDILTLWKNNQWQAPCSQCDGTVHFFRAGGSPLSGMVWPWGLCNSCHTPTKEAPHGFGPFLRSVRTYCTRQKPEECAPIELQKIVQLVVEISRLQQKKGDELC